MLNGASRFLSTTIKEDFEEDEKKEPSNSDPEADSSKIVLTVQIVPQPLNISMQSGQIMSSNDLINQQHTTNEHCK